MVNVSVVIPYGVTGCPYRSAALAWVMGWWRDRHPDWQVVVSTPHAGGDPWCKAAAVADAMRDAVGRVVVVADADVVCDGVGPAVEQVLTGRHPWAVPHHGVFRLTRAATDAVHAGAALPDVRQPRSLIRHLVGESHRGVVGGGLVVIPREVWPRVPLDARFRGWGQEDLAWGWALARCEGPPWRGSAPLVHLWHPPAERASRVQGSTDSMRLWNRYRRAYTAAEVVALLDEPGARPGKKSPPRC